MQLAIPPGEEPRAEGFYAGLLGLRSVEKPLQLRHLGVWERAAGLAFGRCNPVSATPPDELDRMLLEATRGSGFPIAVDFDFGHTEPHCTLPWGVRARLDADARPPTLSLLEPAVA